MSRDDGETGGETGGAARQRRWIGPLLALVAVALLLIPVAIRATIDGRAELTAADQAQAQGDVDGEIRHLGRAARWAVPLAGHDEAARERLRALALAADAADDHAKALVAWRELRRALLATRTLGVADPQQLAEANAAIVEAMDREAAIAGQGIDRPRQTAALEATPGPEPTRSHLAAVCLAGWLLALVGFFMRGIDGAGRLRRGPALGWGAAGLVLLVAWILAM